jgi:hypothetical protein
VLGHPGHYSFFPGLCLYCICAFRIQCWRFLASHGNDERNIRAWSGSFHYHESISSTFELDRHPCPYAKRLVRPDFLVLCWLFSLCRGGTILSLRVNLDYSQLIPRLFLAMLPWMHRTRWRSWTKKWPPWRTAFNLGREEADMRVPIGRNYANSITYSLSLPLLSVWGQRRYCFVRNNKCVFCVVIRVNVVCPCTLYAH